MSPTNSQRVGEIFTTAGDAFNTLGQLTSQLESSGPNATKWTDQEIQMLANAVHKFANDLQTISDTIRARTVGQIKGALQKRAFEEAGISIQNQQPVQTLSASQETNNSLMSSTTKQNASVTLNALNATESEVDVEASNDSPLDFESTAADVAI